VLRDQTLELLARFGITADAAFDEQQLIDPEAIRVLIEASGVKSTDTVLEIGPGAGNITVELAIRAAKVLAVEKNQKFIPLLKERLSGSLNVEMILGDALTTPLPVFDVLISNPPSSIAEAILHRIERLRLRVASLIIPSTLARILTANKGEPLFSKLTLETHLFFTVNVVCEVKPGSYYPKPKATTSIIILRTREDTNPIESIIRTVFMQRDKKTRNALREAFIAASPGGFPSTKKAAKLAIDGLSLDEALLGERVARLSIRDVELLYESLECHIA
jgi:16S rRNA A1518/A1519 N6-dimethyltransferase RsmA/KsgA/DIM1 with predicted DNA glycosylase/AP lyase activity